MGNDLFSGIAWFAPLWMVLVSFSVYFGIRPGNRQDRGQNYSRPPLFSDSSAEDRI
jgi:hypothetical protein